MELIFVKHMNMNSHTAKLSAVQTPEMPSARNPQWELEVLQRAPAVI